MKEQKREKIAITGILAFACFPVGSRFIFDWIKWKILKKVITKCFTTRKENTRKNKWKIQKQNEICWTHDFRVHFGWNCYELLVILLGLMLMMSCDNWRCWRLRGVGISDTGNVALWLRVMFGCHLLSWLSRRTADDKR